MMETAALLKKYNVAAPRYTSYPTVPYWETAHFTGASWQRAVVQTYQRHADKGISVYIHLPFCESLCTYCGCNTRITKNHAVEKPYIEAILREWEMYVTLLGEKPKIKELHLGGGTPTFFSPEHLTFMIQGIAGNADFTDDAALSFEAHPANTTTDHLKNLYEAGFRRLSLGIQDFDSRVQFLINRYQTPEQVFEVTSQARSIGYQSVNFDLIYGLPGQTMAGLADTVQAVIAMRPDRIAFYSYAHVPWLKPGQRHYTEKDLPAGDDKFALYQLGKNMLTDAGYGDVGMDHFALTEDSLFKAMQEKQLHRNFMGYTHQHTHLLIGLGVSAISDSWNAFAQNPKIVESYLEQVNSGVLPVVKGHLLDEKDLEIRKHILDLMCREKTLLNESVSQSILSRLQPLIQDGLVSVNHHEIAISASGKSFLRNVCMAFDEKLWYRQPDTQIFSSSI